MASVLALAFTLNQVEAPTVTLAQQTVECWSDLHLPIVVVGVLCGVLLYFETLIAGTSEYFLERVSP